MEYIYTDWKYAGMTFMENLMKNEKSVIKLNNVNFSYKSEKKVFDDLTFEIFEGEAVGIIGANGCGKSTLLKMISGLLGDINGAEVLDYEVKKPNFSEIRKELGYLLQDSDNQLFMPTVKDDIAFAPHNYGQDKETIDKKIDEVLDKLGINYLKDRHNNTLSGGEKKMACMATVLAMNPGIILFDEPTIALDPANRRRVINILNEMNVTKIIASHDLDAVLETCERVILLDNKKIAADGPAEDILRNKELLEKCHLELPLCMQGIKVYNKGQES